MDAEQALEGLTKEEAEMALSAMEWAYAAVDGAGLGGNIRALHDSAKAKLRRIAGEGR